MSTTIDPLRQRLGALARGGGEAFDAPGLKRITALLDRADRATPGAASRLRDRATAFLDRLEAALAGARERAADTVAELDARGFDRRSGDASLAQGDVVAVRRAARRYRGRPPGAWSGPRRLEITPTARPQGVFQRARRAQAARSAPRRAVAASDATRLRLAELVTALSIERTVRTMPAEPGPYNGRAVAARLLEVVGELSPIYAHAQIERMRELAALTQLAAPTPPRRSKRR